MDPNRSNERESKDRKGLESSWEPHFEVICLACEISAYAPDEDGTPLF